MSEAMKYQVSDWVKYLNDDGEETIEEIIRIDGTAIYTAGTGKYWLTNEDIFAYRSQHTFDQAREALKVALIGLERVRPQTKGVLVVQDVEAGIQEAKAALAAMEGQP